MKCWFCGKDKMEPIEGLPHWFQCSECGATDGPPLPNPGHPATAIGNSGMNGKPRGRPWGSKIK